MKLKKKFLIGGVFSLVLIVITILMIFLLGTNQEEKLNSNLEKMGKEFYHNFYSELSSNKSKEELNEELAKHVTLGISIDLNGLINYNKENTKIIEKFTNKGQACVKESTRVTIYPKEPFGKNDYEIKTVLDCGFTHE